MLKHTDLVLRYIRILTNHTKLLFTASLNMDRLRGCTAKPYMANLHLRGIKDLLLWQRLRTDIKAYEQNQTDIR